MPASYWRGIAAPIIAEVIAKMEGKPIDKIKVAISKRYPFGERENHPYKIWLDEIARQLKTKPPLGTKIETIDPNQQKLL